MINFVNFIIKLRWFIAIFIPIITLLFALQLKDVQFDGSYRIWFAKDSKTLQEYDDFKDIFGSDSSIMIAFNDPNGVMNAKALNVIDRLTTKLWETKYVIRVDSLTNYQYIHLNVDDSEDIIIEDFIDDISLLSKEELKEKEKIAINEDLLVDHIISKDGKTTMITARILLPQGEKVLGAVDELNKVLYQYTQEEKESGYTFHLAGGVVLNKTFSNLAKHDAAILTPMILIISMLLLWIIFKRASGVLISIAIVIFTFIIVVSLQVIFGFKLNNFTANMPIFIIAIGIADAMHLYLIYLLGRGNGLDNYGAIHYTVERNFLPILLTSVTTAVGFASLGISEVLPIRTLGIAIASAALLAFFLTIVFVPAVLAIINPKVKVVNVKKESKLFHDIASKYASFIIRHDLKIILISVLVFGAMGLGLMKLKIDSNTVHYFKEDVPFRKTINFIEEKLTGPMLYEIVVDSKEKNGIKNPEFMRKVEEFEIAFKQKYSHVRHISSLIDVVKKINEIMMGTKEIPKTQNNIAQFLLLYSFSLPQGMEINDKMDVDERLLRLTATIDVVDTSVDLEMINWVEKWWSKTSYGVSLNGQNVMFAHMQHDITNTLMQSILLTIIIVSLMMFLIFKKVKMIPLFIIPNVLPIILVLGVMGWIGISIDVGVAITGAIIIGVAVDDTIHFLVKYKEARLKGYNFHNSLTYVMQYAGSAIVFTTVILSTAFMVFSFSQFLPNVNFGIVTALALVIAVAVDLIMLPAILSRYDGKGSSFLNE